MYGIGIVAEYLPYFIGAGVLIVLLIVATFILRAWSRSRVASIGASGGGAMGFGDIDAMLRKGLISKEEHARIRNRLATREVERSRQQESADRDRILIAQIERDPSVARELLPPEANARDIDRMLEMGMITREQYEKLRRD